MTSLPTDNIRVIPYSQISYDDVGFTLEEVGGALQENREHFDSLFHDIQAVTGLFNEDCTIMPVQCREAIKSLEKAQSQAQRLYSLLDEPEQLPFIFSALRYRLIFQVHIIEKQGQQLICFIESYRAICTDTALSFNSRQRRKQIYHAFETLLDAISGISNQINFIKHEAHFHQKRLTTYNKSIKTSDASEKNDTSKKRILCLQAQQE